MNQTHSRPPPMRSRSYRKAAEARAPLRFPQRVVRAIVSGSGICKVQPSGAFMLPDVPADKRFQSRTANSMALPQMLEGAVSERRYGKIRAGFAPVSCAPVFGAAIQTRTSQAWQTP